MKEGATLQKISEHPFLIFGTGIVTLTDAISTTLAHFQTNTAELNPIIAPLMSDLAPASMITLLALAPLPIITLFLYLWARVGMEKMFRNTFITIILSKGIASINNYLIYQGQPVNELVYLTYLPIIILPTAGAIQEITSAEERNTSSSNLKS